MQILSKPTEAENTLDFALEEIISENGLKVSLKDIGDVSLLPAGIQKSLKKVGRREVDESGKVARVELFQDLSTKKYYKSTLESN